MLPRVIGGERDGGFKAPMMVSSHVRLGSGRQLLLLHSSSQLFQPQISFLSKEWGGGVRESSRN